MEGHTWQAHVPSPFIPWEQRPLLLQGDVAPPGHAVEWKHMRNQKNCGDYTHRFVYISDGGSQWIWALSSN